VAELQLDLWVCTTNPHEATRQEIDAATVAWREARAARLEADKAAASLKEVEDLYKTFVVEALRAQEIEGVLIDGRLTSLASKTQPIVEDRALVENFILEHRALELLQFRLSSAAVKERRGAGEEIPGIGDMVTYDLSDKKSK